MKDFAGLDGHLPEVALAIGHAVEGASVHLSGAPDDLDKEADPMRVSLAGVDRSDSLTEFGMAQGASFWTSALKMVFVVLDGADRRIHPRCSGLPQILVGTVPQRGLDLRSVLFVPLDFA